MNGRGRASGVALPRDPLAGRAGNPAPPRSVYFVSLLGLVRIGGAVLGSLRRGLDKSRRSVAVGVTGLGLNTVAPRCHVKLSLRHKAGRSAEIVPRNT